MLYYFYIQVSFQPLILTVIAEKVREERIPFLTQGWQQPKFQANSGL